MPSGPIISPQGGRAPTRVATLATSQQWLGPLPSPDALKQFDQIVPGAAERILADFEKQTQHRQTLEKAVVESRVSSTKRGQWFAFIIAGLFLSFAAFSVYMEQPLLAGVIGAIDIVGLVGSFLYSQYSQKEERRQRDEQQA